MGDAGATGGDVTAPRGGSVGPVPGGLASAKTPAPVTPKVLPLARHGRLPVEPVRLAILRFMGVALVVLLVSATSVVGIAIWNVTSGLKPGVSLPNDAGPVVKPKDGAINLLLVGSDSGGGDPAYGERSATLNDVTILLHVSEDHGSATVVSFPRDMLVEIPWCAASADGTTPGTDGGFTDMLNTSLSYGGLGCTVAMIEQLTGMTIPYAAEIEFNGVIEMSNAVGGVPVCIAERIDDPYTGLILDPGTHDLEGMQALQFLRTRHGLVSGSDLARIGNQQAFLASLVRTIKSEGTLGDPLTLYSLAKAAGDNMVLSTSLQPLDTMVAIALALQDIDLNNVTFVQYPVAGTYSGIEPLTDDAAALFDALENDQPIALSGTVGEATQVEPSAAPTEQETPEETAEPWATDAATDAPTLDAGEGPLKLPATISGQTAAEETCTVGQSLGD